MKKILFFIILILFIVPFFWFKPGEVNLGGDSSRLYFYDPINYLKIFLLYNIIPGETGPVWGGYNLLPFVALLALLKSIVQSPSLVINLFHSFMLITSFLFTYLTIVELFKFQKKKNEVLVQIVGILGGLFYSCMSILGNNWDKALVTHNEIFLNPLNFYLLLRYVHTNNHLYPLIIILVTFLFAPNFSWIGTPAVVAFYSFSVLYLLLYKKFIVKTPFLWKNISLLFCLLLLVHSFHFIPQVYYLFFNESNAPQGIFSTGFSSDATTYFQRTAENVKLTSNLINISNGDVFSSFFLFLFPSILVAGLFFHNRLIKQNSEHISRNFILLSCIFLIILFFTTANITSIGFSFYKSLFSIPGFAMFKNFQGKFLYVYMFFYALVFSYSFYYVYISLRKKIGIILLGLFVALILIKSIPFLKGDLVNQPLYQANKNVKVPFKMDPEFEKVLTYIRNQPVDARYLTVPLTDFGYQVLGGTDGGVYIGPTMIGYLTGKKDFTGSGGFSIFGEPFLHTIREQNYELTTNILSLFNVRYVFHNSDPAIYKDTFPAHPYMNTHRYMPANQEKYTQLIQTLSFKKKIDFGNKYHIYEVSEKNFIPHIYVAKDAVQVNNIPEGIPRALLFYKDDKRIAFYDTANINKIHSLSGTLFLQTQRRSPTLESAKRNNALRVTSLPSPTREFSLYPLALLFEKMSTQLGETVPNASQSADTIDMNYSVDIPIDGTYEVYVEKKLLKTINENVFHIALDGKSLNNTDSQEHLVRFDDISLAKQKQMLTLTTPRFGNLLNDNVWEIFQNSKSNKNSTSVLLSDQALVYTRELVSFFTNWAPNSKYSISFEYQPIQGVVGSSEWTKFRAFVETDEIGREVLFQLLPDMNVPAGQLSENVAFNFRNLSILPIEQPAVLLRKKVDTELNSKSLPKITFEKVNSTKYRIEVTEAKDPFTLVFLEAFNNDWRLFLSDTNNKTQQITARYFNGEIREGNHTNTFFNNTTFETVGKQPIADKTHSFVNGYGNSWYITPTDVGGKSEYVLVLEITSQRMFYYMIPVTVGSIIICLFLLLLMLKRKRQLHESKNK